MKSIRIDRTRRSKLFRLFQISLKLKKSHLILVYNRHLILDLSGWSPHSSLLHARAGLDKVPGSLEEQIIVVIQRVHRPDGEVYLDYIRGGLDVHR